MYRNIKSKIIYLDLIISFIFVNMVKKKVLRFFFFFFIRAYSKRVKEKRVKFYVNIKLNECKSKVSVNA